MKQPTTICFENEAIVTLGTYVASHTKTSVMCR
jgi:hypothetical protein